MKPIALATRFINGYISEKLSDDRMTPFFPVSPTAIDDFTEQFPEGNQFYVYDRMMKMRRTPFPHIKNEQMLMYFYARSTSDGLDSISNIIESSQKIQDLLDRGDESAQDLNAWIESKLTVSAYAENNGERVLAVGTYPHPGYKEFRPVYFHSFKVFQLQETADIIDFGTARTWADNKLILDYSYHTSKDYNSTL